MSRPTTRVLALLELLQARGQCVGAELARELGVDARTLRRYIATLEDLGIPITTERGRFGGYALVPGFKLPPLMFNDDEALALSLGLLAARELGLHETAPAVASAQAKLERVLPLPLKRRLRAAGETIALEMPRTQRGLGHPQDLALLASAAQARQTVHLSYRSANGDATRRDFDPYALAWRGGRWYAVGHCHLRRGLRSFRLDRIDTVVALPKSFARPDQFDPIEYLTHSIATLPRDHAIEVLLRTDLHVARREVFPGIGVLEAHADGCWLRAQADDLDWFARELSRLPFEFSVVAPMALRAAVRACGLRLQRLADATPSTPQ